MIHIELIGRVLHEYAIGVDGICFLKVLAEVAAIVSRAYLNLCRFTTSASKLEAGYAALLQMALGC